MNIGIGLFLIHILTFSMGPMAANALAIDPPTGSLSISLAYPSGLLKWAGSLLRSRTISIPNEMMDSQCLADGTKLSLQFDPSNSFFTYTKISFHDHECTFLDAIQTYAGPLTVNEIRPGFYEANISYAGYFDIAVKSATSISITNIYNQPLPTTAEPWIELNAANEANSDHLLGEHVHCVRDTTFSTQYDCVSFDASLIYDLTLPALSNSSLIQNEAKDWNGEFDSLGTPL